MSALRDQLVGPFIEDMWGPMNIDKYNGTINDIITAIGMVQHCVCSNMTGGKASLSDT